jgi:hypothetical protein
VKYCFWITVILIIIFPACNKKADKNDEEAIEIKKTPFIPPLDSSITTEQMRKWICCNSRLDSLSEVYLDSLRTENPERRISSQSNFTRSQDTICIREGLPGGYDEYVWILKNSGNKKNKALFDSLITETD